MPQSSTAIRVNAGRQVVIKTMFLHGDTSDFLNCPIYKAEYLYSLKVVTGAEAAAETVMLCLQLESALNFDRCITSIGRLPTVSILYTFSAPCVAARACTD